MKLETPKNILSKITSPHKNREFFKNKKGYLNFSKHEKKMLQASSFKSQGMLHEKGFTLVELVVYTALFGLIMIFLFNFLLGVISHQSKGKIREAVINNATHTINTIDSEIRRAYGIYDPTSEFDNAAGQLSLLTRGSLPAGETYTHTDIYLSNNNEVCMKKESSGVVCLTTSDVNVTQLEFKKITLADGSESGVQTKITVEYNTSDEERKAPMNIQTFTRLRNE